jgi:hypothetical protein
MDHFQRKRIEINHATALLGLWAVFKVLKRAALHPHRSFCKIKVRDVQPEKFADYEIALRVPINVSRFRRHANAMLWAKTWLLSTMAFREQFTTYGAFND